MYIKNAGWALTLAHRLTNALTRTIFYASLRKFPVMRDVSCLPTFLRFFSLHNFIIALGFLVSYAAGEKMEPFSVLTLPEGDMRYTLEIKSKSSHNIIQTISIRNGHDLSVAGRLKIVNVCGTGKLELQVYGGETDKGPWYKIWKFDQKEKEFTWSHTTETGKGR